MYSIIYTYREKHTHREGVHIERIAICTPIRFCDVHVAGNCYLYTKSFNMEPIETIWVYI